MSIKEELIDFMKSKRTNAWIGDNFIQVYVRKGIHSFGGDIIKTFDVANIEQDPIHIGKGYFKSFMIQVEEVGLPIYVENIHNPKLTEMLAKNGYLILTSLYSTHAIKNF